MAGLSRALRSRSPCLNPCVGVRAFLVGVVAFRQRRYSLGSRHQQYAYLIDEKQGRAYGKAFLRSRWR